MKKFVSVLGWVLLTVAIVLGIGATYIHYTGIPSYDPPHIPDVKVEITPQKVEQGQKIASMLCMHCHSNSDNRMTGRKLTDLPSEFGDIYSTNITGDEEKGIGKWTDGELIYFLRTGLHNDGSYAPPYMPKFPLLSDDDIQSIVAWLRSGENEVKATREEPPTSDPSFLVKALSYVVFKPLPYPDKAIEKPDTTNQVEWGKYLSNKLYGCFQCHSADFKTNSDLEPEKSEGFYGGGNTLINLVGSEIKSLNITPDTETGIGSWTEEDFVNAMRAGKRKNGEQLRYPMLPYTRLTDGELKAIYAYLRTVPAIKHKVQ